MQAIRKDTKHCHFPALSWESKEAEGTQLSLQHVSISYMYVPVTHQWTQILDWEQEFVESVNFFEILCVLVSLKLPKLSTDSSSKSWVRENYDNRSTSSGWVYLYGCGTRACGCM